MRNQAKELAKLRSALKALPHIKTEYVQRDSGAFDYCKSREKFIIIAPFFIDELSKLKILTGINLIFYGKTTHRLFGGSLLAKDSFIDAANKIMSKEYNAIYSLDEFYPLAYVENIFTYKRDKTSMPLTCRHEGMVYVARMTRSSSTPDTHGVYDANRYAPLDFTNPSDTHIFNLVSEYLDKYQFTEENLMEIKLSREIGVDRRSEHKKELIKKIQKLQNEKIDTQVQPQEKLNKTIVDLIKTLKPSKIIDIACGDNKLIHNIDTESVEVWANDIACSYIDTICDGKPDITFTNFDATKTNFKDKYFNVVLAKNLLHHLRSLHRARAFIAESLRIGEYLLLVEILHYSEQTRSGQTAYNEYYSKHEGAKKCHYYKNEVLLSLVGSHVIIRDEFFCTINGKYKILLVCDGTKT